MRVCVCVGGGGAEVVYGGNSEGCLKWRGGGSLRSLNLNYLKRGGQSQKLFVGWRGS